ECCGTWTPEGNFFVYQAQSKGIWNIWVMPEDHRFWKREAPHATQLTTGPLSYYSPLPNRNGTKLFVIGQQPRSELVRYNSESKKFEPYLSGISAGQLEASRDGKWITYVVYPEATLWRSRVDGSERIQLTHSPMLV